MSEIRINIIDDFQTISGEMHGSFGDVLAISLCAEPETVEELETSVERFIKRESDWSVFRSFRTYENFEPWDAGLLVIDLSARTILADSTYSYYSREGTVRIKTDTGEDFNLPYRLSDDWKCVGSMPEYDFWKSKRYEEKSAHPPFAAREILFGKPLFEYIAAAYLENKNSADEDLFTNVHAEWLMTERGELSGKTPREILLEKREFISFDLHSRSLQWSFTKVQPPALPKESNAYKFAGYGTHEIVIHYELFRHLLNECFENEIADAEILRQIADAWLNNPNGEFSGRIPSQIIEAERRRINLTMSAHECLIDEDCEVCQMMAADFIDTPMFWGLDGSQMEYDRFEFSFYKSREEWEAEQKRYEEFNREFAEKYQDNNDFDFSDGDEIIF